MAVMARIDSDLAMGGHAELLGELESLVESEPLQERLRGQLMLALYRAGRQADALAVYRDTSDLLREELGLEPGHALRELERSILNQDATLDPAPSPGPSPPTRLPVPGTPFLGRARELGEISALLKRSDTRLLTLTGAGGSGKTRLALRAAEARGQDYERDPCFVGFADITDPDLIAPTICEAVGVAEQPGLTPVQRLEQRLAGHRLLLVLDNLEQLAAGTALLGQLLAACPGLTLLVTSREPLHLAGERQYEVPVLDLDDAVELFTTRAQAIKPDVELEAELAAAICERLDRLPLAIELAAARTKALSPTELLARLDRSLPLLTGGPRDAPQRQRTSASDDRLELRAPQRPTAAAVRADGRVRGRIARSRPQRPSAKRSSTRYRRSLTAASSAATASATGCCRRCASMHSSDSSRPARRRRCGALMPSGSSNCSRPNELAPPGWPTERSRHHVFARTRELQSSAGMGVEHRMTEILARLAAPLVGVWITGGQLQEAERWTALMLERTDEYPERLAAQVVSAARSHRTHRGDYVEAVVLSNRALARWREVGDPDAIGREMASAFASPRWWRPRRRTPRPRAGCRVRAGARLDSSTGDGVEQPGRSRDPRRRTRRGTLALRGKSRSVRNRVRLGGHRTDPPCAHRVPRRPARRGRTVGSRGPRGRSSARRPADGRMGNDRTRMVTRRARRARTVRAAARSGNRVSRNRGCRATLDGRSL